MPKPTIILRQKALNYLFENSTEKNAAYIFEQAMVLYSLISEMRNAFNYRGIISEILWFSSVTDFEIDFFNLVNTPLKKRFETQPLVQDKELMLKVLIEVYNQNNWDSKYLNKLLHLNHSLKKYNFYFKKLLKGFSPKTDIEKSFYYAVIQLGTTHVTKRMLMEEGINTDFFELKENKYITLEINNKIFELSIFEQEDLFIDVRNSNYIFENY